MGWPEKRSQISHVVTNLADLQSVSNYQIVISLSLSLSLSLSVFDKFLISLQVTVIDAARVVFIQLLHIMATRLAAGSSK